jgi:hypothetical protein
MGMLIYFDNCNKPSQKDQAEVGLVNEEDGQYLTDLIGKVIGKTQMTMREVIKV